MGSRTLTPGLEDTARMVGGTSGKWKRPVNRMYTYNYQVGENYYLPMTSYLESKKPVETPTPTSDLPGPLCFSERIAVHPLVGQQPPDMILSLSHFRGL